MKKRLFAAAAAGLLLLTACGRSQPRPIPVDVPLPIEQKNDTLKVFCVEFGSLAGLYLETAATMYRAQFPDRKLELEKYAPEEMEAGDSLNQKMLTQVMAGEGPDIFLLPNYADIEKMARTGVFADMEPYFQADSYDWSDFNQPVMEAGVWEGKRLVIPLLYDLPIFYTSKAALEETSFDVENCGTYQGFLEEMENYISDSSQTRYLIDWYLFFRYAPEIIGLSYLDYDAGTIDLSSPDLERVAEIYKELVNGKAGITGGGGLGDAAEIRDGNVLWVGLHAPMYDAIHNAGAINTFSEPATVAFRDKDGGLRAEITDAVAVRNNSENLQNAYDFLKILLSEELGQETMRWRWRQFSVRNSLLYDYYDYAVTNRPNPFILPNEPVAGFTDLIPPAREEFNQFLEYTKEVTGAYYRPGDTSFGRNLEDFGYVEGKVTYEEFIKGFQRQLEIYLSE